MKNHWNALFNFSVSALITSGVVILTMASLAHAKVDNFGDLIQDNISAQNELHNEVRQQMKVTRDQLKPGQAATVVVDDGGRTQINTPTSKRMLRYRKETAAKQVSKKKQMDRVAQEFDDANSSF